MKKEQRAVAIGIIQKEDGRILMQQRNDPKFPEAHEKWELPGGAVEFGETPEETVKRECLEEVGCDIEVEKLLPFVHSKTWISKDNDLFHVVVLGFKCRILKGEARPLDKKVSEVRWCTKEEIKELDTLPGIKEFVSLV